MRSHSLVSPARLLLIALTLGCATTAAPPPLPAPPALNDASFQAGRAQAAQRHALSPALGRARNVILFLGDGMGITTVTAARILEGQRRGEPGEENLLAFEKLPYTAFSKTWNTDQQVPDSAGTMTAIVSGVKTRAGVLGVDGRVVRGDHASVEASRVPTLLEQAEERGLWTGIVTTTTVTHATPGACYAHVPHRDWEDDTKLSEAARAAGFPDIARQLVELPGDGVEVVLGGGRQHFLPKESADPEHEGKRGARGDGRDLVRAWRARHPDGEAVWRRTDFERADGASTRYLLGLFEPSHMSFELDRARDPGGEPSLSEMTAKALDVLQRGPRGYFLMVEGGRIDHGHHVGNAARALTEAIEFSNAVRVAMERTSPADTLIVVTADHSHVLTFAGYPRRGNPILGLVRGSGAEGEGDGELARDALGLPYTTLGYANGPGYTGASEAQPAGPKRFPHLPRKQNGIARGRPNLEGVATDDPGYLQETAVPMMLETHGGEDVPVYAGGPGAALFRGVVEQSYLYHAMVEALGWTATRE
jgi:alkaline phosphatase